MPERTALEHNSKLPTLRSFRREFLDWISSENLNHHTKLAYIRSFDAVLKVGGIADLPIDQINERVIDEFTSSALQTLSSATVRRCLATLRKALHTACRRGFTDRTPPFSFDRLKKPIRRKPSVVLTVEEFRVLLAAIPDEPCHTMLIAAGCLGLRGSTGIM